MSLVLHKSIFLSDYYFKKNNFQPNIKPFWNSFLRLSLLAYWLIKLVWFVRGKHYLSLNEWNPILSGITVCKMNQYTE